MVYDILCVILLVDWMGLVDEEVIDVVRRFYVLCVCSSCVCGLVFMWCCVRRALCLCVIVDLFIF